MNLTMRAPSAPPIIPESRKKTPAERVNKKSVKQIEYQPKSKRMRKHETHKEKISNVRFIVGGQYGITKKPDGKEYKEVDMLLFSLYKYSNKIKIYKVSRGKSPMIDGKNYSKFALAYDQDRKDLIKDIIKKSEVPYVTSCATLYDSGEFYRFSVNLQESLRTIFRMNYNNGGENKNIHVYSYPRHIVDFNPINIIFIYDKKEIAYSISFQNSKVDPKCKNYLPLLKTGGISKNNSIDLEKIYKTYLKTYLSELGCNDEKTNAFYKYLKDINFVKFVENKPIVKTVDLNDEKIRRAIQGDMWHDFKNKFTSKYPTNEYFDNKLKNEFNTNVNFMFDPTKETPKKTNSTHIFKPDVPGNISFENAPFICKTLGDLGQIIYCMERNVFFGTGDQSAVSMGINLSRQIGNVKKLKVIFESPKEKSIQTFAYVNFPSNYEPSLRYLNTTNKRYINVNKITNIKMLKSIYGMNSIILPEITRYYKKTEPENFRHETLKLLGVNAVKKLASATPTFKEGSPEQEVYKKIKNALNINKTTNIEKILIKYKNLTENKKEKIRNLLNKNNSIKMK